jgi:RNA recognition motif-containing protein
VDDDFFFFTRVRKKRPQKKFVSENLRKVFIGGVGPNTNEEALSEYFAKWSALEDSCVLRDPKTKK